MSRNTPKATAIGGRIRAARQATGKGLREVARGLGIDHSKLSRYENGERVPPVTELASILGYLGVNGEEREDALRMAEDPESSSWLAVGLPEQRLQTAALIETEGLSSNITDVAPLVIPGLLQIGDYVRGILRAAGAPPEEIATRVAVRVGRSEVLTRSHSPVQFTAFIGEAALRNHIGGPEVMARQLEHLLVMGARPNINLHVFKIGTDWHPGLDGPVVLLTIDKATTVVFLENRRSGLFLQGEEDVAAYKTAVEKVRRVSLDPVQSTEFIEDVAKQMR
ncbi:helix-turn-helix transcriptional regulator [Lentzea sp. NBRC 105346]|uniref:helix-turn-helix domain-containing protein n=1 Tax=Lentzea sp. NBRC 105346 TaxID=3032205 RepID=UPI0025530BA7|nr:helix-turn-helix transcriptional regulator [Lentzea sp. NBRC 105346]